MKKFKKVMIAFVIVLITLTLGIWAFMQHPMFGALPTKGSLARIQQSPNFKDGQFVNQELTPDLTEGVSYYAVLKEFIFQKDARNTPVDSLPSQITDLKSLSPEANTLVWFGHSSYFLQIEGKKILVDPVFSGAASPVKFTTPSYKGSDVYKVEDFPDIDYLFISHDHWDHLDYETLDKMRGKVKKVITGLGVGAHLERWGYNPENIIETDWYDTTLLDNGFSVVTTPARHFSGRGFSRNKSLWASFVLQAPHMRIYIGGDSGYGKHFVEIGEKYGPFDLALLECGQYDKSWKYIHMLPHEIAQAALDLKASKLMPVHWSKFSLGIHAWDEPIIQVCQHCQKHEVPILTPMIGEKVDLNENKVFNAWWVGLK